MPRCWEIRDCDSPEGGDLIETCPHPNELFDNCPTKCAFANCQRDQRVVCCDAELIFDPTLDRSPAVKDVCYHCEFFLKNGPRVGDTPK